MAGKRGRNDDTPTGISGACGMAPGEAGRPDVAPPGDPGDPSYTDGETDMSVWSGTVPVGLVLAASAAALPSMAMVAWIDLRRFEIDPGWLSAAALAAVMASLPIEGFGYLYGALAAGALSGGSVWLVSQLARGRIGRGDIGLLAAVGLVAGPSDLPLAMACVAGLTALTAGLLARARGKPPFRSAVPLALPAMAALAPLFVLRVYGGILDAPLPAATLVPTATATAVALTCAGLLASARLPHDPARHRNRRREI